MVLHPIDRSSPRRHRTSIARVAVLALGVTALASCGDDSESGGDATVVDVELGRYTIVPGVITAPAGEVALRVTNVDVGMVHDLVVASKGTRPLAPGESYTLPLGEIAAGEYPAWCDQPGHRQLGQTAVLQVTPASPSTAATP